MSSDRSNARPVKPTLASTRTARTPLAPRLAVNAAPPPRSIPPTTTARRVPAPAPPPEPPTSTPRPRQPQVRQEETPVKDASGTANITPRSSARKSRVESANSTPSQAGDSPNLLRPRVSGTSTSTNGERAGGVGGLGVGSGSQGRMPNGRPKSMASESGSYRGHTPMMVRSPGHTDLGSPPPDESIDSRFFHASDMSRQEPAPKRPAAKKAPTFFYADARQGQHSDGSSRATSPGLSAVSEQRSTGPWARTESHASSVRSGPLLSPSLNSLPSASPFFTVPPPKAVKSRSPSPNKDNIHLSYRKGVSQIFGSRPSPTNPQPLPERPTTEPEPRRISSESRSYQPPHRKTPSLSSIDSGSSHPPRRRSATTLDAAALAPSPLSLEAKSATYPKLARPLPSIDTTDPSAIPLPEGPLSPTKTPAGISAPDARRERKVLDLEISNSSLLAINSSLEREVRRQKAELKRFRRLSRAGRFSVGPGDRSARLSEGLSTLGEEDEESDFDEDAPDYPAEDLSDEDEEDDDEDEGDEGDPLSPTAQEAKHKDRLASDEKRLRVDLAKHKELLVQSQMMNQSLKRCTYTTETMIRDGRKALAYNVRVSDVKLGGRILTGHEDDEEVVAENADLGHGDAEAGVGGQGLGLGIDIEAEDETLQGAQSVDEQARGFLDMWQGLGSGGAPGTGATGGVSAAGVGGIWGGGSQRSFEDSEGGDRDSGIEVDKVGWRGEGEGLKR